MNQDLPLHEKVDDLLQENKALRDVLRHTSYLLEQRSREYGLYRMVVETVNRVVTEPNALKLVLDHVRELLGAENGSIMLYDTDKEELTITAATGTKDSSPRSVTVSPGRGIAGRAFECGETIFLPDATEDAHFADYGQDANIRSLICMPISHEGEILGVLNLSHNRRNAFAESGVRTLEIIIPQIAIAIRNITSLSHHMDKADILRRKNRELEEANRRLAETQRELVKMERLKAINEISISMNHEINNPLAGILGDVQLLISKQAGEDPVSRYHLEDVQKQCYRISDILQKLRSMEEAVSVDYADGLRMIDLNKSSSVLPLFERVQDSYFTMLRESLERWEENSRYWRGHSARTAELATQLARHLRMRDREIQLVKKLGSVWNVGVLTVNEKLLHKEENLSEVELAIVESRREVSRSLLEPLCVSLFSPAETDGLGKEKPSSYAVTQRHEAVLHIANAFVALISDRPHRASCSPAEAYSTLDNDLEESTENIEVLVALRKILGLNEGAGEEEATA